MWRRYQSMNNRYQSANVTAGLSCQHDAKGTSRTRRRRCARDWQRADIRSSMETQCRYQITNNRYQSTNILKKASAVQQATDAFSFPRADYFFRFFRRFPAVRRC